ncbi:MAG: urease accessory protein UreD [Isosphaeraceae bacterium]|nr:urease accessory protein UreD [Isosphaeraceae bacterium]
MGARPTRIDRQEFVTPPEFSEFQLARAQAARIGGVRLEMIERAGTTRFGSAYHQVPILTMPAFSFDREPAALVYLINLTAGLMNGDGHLVEIVARSGTNTVVTGQSATRIHPAVDSFCTQQWSLEVEPGACLVALPGPAIPYRGSRYYQRGRARLHDGARLIWGDIWLAGRYQRGAASERFVFERIVQELEVRRGDRLIYRDRFRWDGAWTDEEADWYFGGHLAAASLFASEPIPPDIDLSTPGVRSATLPLSSGAVCVRWCGPPALVIESLVRASMQIAGAWHSGSTARPWLLDSTELTPNHWFSKARSVSAEVEQSASSTVDIAIE